MLNLQKSRGGVVFEVLLQPRAEKDKIAGIYGDSLKVMVTSPPVGGKANQACILVIAHAFRLKSNEVEIISGHTSRRKRLYIRGITPEEFKARLDHLIE